MNRAWRRFALRALFSGGLIALLLNRVHWRELGALLHGVQIGPLALGSFFIAVCPFLIAARTRLMLAQWGIALGYPAVLSLTWLGQFCNTFLPGSTGGDAVKFFRVCRIVPEHKAAGLAALLVDRLVALLALVLLAGSAFVFGDHQLGRDIVAGSSLRMGRGGLVVMFGLLLLVSLALMLAWRKYSSHAKGLTVRVGKIIATTRAGFQPSPTFGAALLLAVAVHLLALASCYQFCRALQIPATFGQVMLVWPVTTLAVLLPLTVNGHGLREYILLFYFQRWHLLSALAAGGRITETVLALSLLMVATDFFWSLPGGLCLLLDHGGRVANPFVGRALRLPGGALCPAGGAPALQTEAASK